MASAFWSQPTSHATQALCLCCSTCLKIGALKWFHACCLVFGTWQPSCCTRLVPGNHHAVPPGWMLWLDGCCGWPLYAATGLLDAVTGLLYIAACDAHAYLQVEDAPSHIVWNCHCIRLRVLYLKSHCVCACQYMYCSRLYATATAKVQSLCLYIASATSM